MYDFGLLQHEHCKTSETKLDINLFLYVCEYVQQHFRTLSKNRGEHVFCIKLTYTSLCQFYSHAVDTEASWFLSPKQGSRVQPVPFLSLLEVTRQVMKGFLTSKSPPTQTNCPRKQTNNTLHKGGGQFLNYSNVAYFLVLINTHIPKL